MSKALTRGDAPGGLRADSSLRLVGRWWRFLAGGLGSALVLACAVAGFSARSGDFSLPLVAIPSQAVENGSRAGRSHEEPIRLEFPPYFIGAKEIGVDIYVRFLRQLPSDAPLPPQFERRGGRVEPRPGQSGLPVHSVGLEDARAFCRWLAETTGQKVRLPSEDEWEGAARGGIRGAPYPWGWGNPVRRAHFDRQGPVASGRFPPNPYGLYDMAGNLFEWCESRADPASRGWAVARGGSWAEREPVMLAVHRRTLFPQDYRGPDVGFRVLVDAE